MHKKNQYKNDRKKVGDPGRLSTLGMTEGLLGIVGVQPLAVSCSASLELAGRDYMTSLVLALIWSRRTAPLSTLNTTEYGGRTPLLSALNTIEYGGL